MEDIVSYFFSRSKYFTIIDISDGSINNVEVVKNPAVWDKHGAVREVVKTVLKELGVRSNSKKERR